jgi:hypothetical protein
MLHSASRLAVRTAVALVVVALTSPVWAHDARLQVRVNEPFEVAGRVYPAGSLTLRSMVDYNPTSSIDEIWVDNRCVGMLMAERSAHGAPAASDSVLFERTGRGRLVLVGYRLRGNGDGFRYRPVTGSRKGSSDLFAAR